MEINLYNVDLMVALFGKPEAVRYFANRHPNGIDTSGIAVLQYPDFLCQCMGAKDTDAVNSVQILGEKGSIYVEGGSNGCKRVLLNRKQDTCVLAKEAPKNQWEQEVQGWVELIQSGDYAECIRRMEQTLAVVETLEAARKDAGIRFPSDEEKQY